MLGAWRCLPFNGWRRATVLLAPCPPRCRCEAGVPADRARGFTLLELLIVLVVIGIISSFAVLSTGLADRNKPLGKETQRLVALLRMASEESVQHGDELGMRIDGSAYRFMRYERDTWKPMEDDLFRERELPPELSVKLELEGRPIVLDNPDAGEAAKKDDKKPLTPQIVFLSSGEVSPFVLTLSEHDAPPQYIKSDGNGDFSLNTMEDGKLKAVPP